MWLVFVQIFFAVFGVMDPVGNVPVFLSLTKGMDPAARIALAGAAVRRAALILLIFVFFGSTVLEVFHISLESFRLAGGLVLMLIGLQILFGIKIEDDRPEAGGDLSMVPIATPMIAGPGMLATAVILAKEYGYVLTLTGLAANLALSYVLFRHSGIVLRLLGTKGAHAAAKVMAFILVAIGVEFIRSVLGGA